MFATFENNVPMHLTSTELLNEQQLI